MHVRNIKWIFVGLLFFCFPTADAALWHVLYVLKNCGTVSMRSKVRHEDYLKKVSALLTLKKESHTENHLEFGREKLLSFYSRTSPDASIFCTVIPQENEAKIDVYAPIKSFDREELNKITKVFFDTNESQQTTTYPPE